MAGGYQTTGETAPPLGGWLNGLSQKTITRKCWTAITGHLKFFHLVRLVEVQPGSGSYSASTTTKAYCLAETGKTYALWLPARRYMVSLQLPESEYMWPTGLTHKADTGFEKAIKISRVWKRAISRCRHRIYSRETGHYGCKRSNRKASRYIDNLVWCDDSGTKCFLPKRDICVR